MNFSHDETTTPCVSCPNDGKCRSGKLYLFFFLQITITLDLWDQTDAERYDMQEIASRKTEWSH